MTNHSDLLKVQTKPKMQEDSMSGEMPEKTHRTGVHSPEFHRVHRESLQGVSGERRAFFTPVR